MVEVAWEEVRYPESKFQITSLLNSFTKLGSLGGLAGKLELPWEAMMVREKQLIDNNRGKWCIALSNIDIHAITTLYNVIVFSHLNVNSLKYALIQSTVPAESLLEVPSGVTLNLPFIAQITVNSDEVSISVEFASQMLEVECKEVESLLLSWAYITAAGGFENDIWTVRGPLLVPNDDPYWIGREVWLHLEDCVFSETALDSLVNGLCGVHSHICPINRVEIQ
jgi:hypothetical protein